jgi:hypothetical protein
MRPRTNTTLPIVWAVLLLVVLLVARPLPYLFLLEGLVFGAIGGALQRRSFVLSGRELFRATKSIDIREILRGRAPGRLYILVYWLFSIFFVLLPMLRVVYFGLGALMGPFLALFAFNLVRDGSTLPSVIAMEKAERAEQAAQSQPVPPAPVPPPPSPQG